MEGIAVYKNDGNTEMTEVKEDHCYLLASALVAKELDRASSPPPGQEL